MFTFRAIMNERVKRNSMFYSCSLFLTAFGATDYFRVLVFTFFHCFLLFLIFIFIVLFLFVLLMILMSRAGDTINQIHVR